MKNNFKTTDDHKPNLAIVGFGYIGTCIGAIFAERGFHVIGIDSKKEIVEEINRGKTSIPEPGLNELIHRNVKNGRLSCSDKISHVKEADIIIVTVGSPLGENNRADLSQIISVSTEISPYLKRGHTVIFKSTIPPYTTERIIRPILEKSGLQVGEFSLAFCPERLAEGNAIHEFQSIPVIVGGVTDQCTKLVSLFFEKALGVKAIPMENARSAEMTKFANNLWIDLNIALANEIAMLCDKLEVDALDIIAAANTLPKLDYNVNILTPSMGVGGYCLTKDPWFLYHLGLDHGLNLVTPVTSRTVNEKMPIYTFEMICDELKKKGKPIYNSKVAILGISFKSNTGDCRLTPTKKTIEHLEKSGCDLSICDPLVSVHEAKTVTQKGLVPTIEETLKDADCVAFFTGHREFKLFPLEKLFQLTKPDAVIIDGRFFFTKSEIHAIRNAGLTYKGIGR